MNAIYRRCHWCGELLRYHCSAWVHLDGGQYMMQCPVCGWKGAPSRIPSRCPRCGAETHQDHCAFPEPTPEEYQILHAERENSSYEGEKIPQTL